MPSCCNFLIRALFLIRARAQGWARVRAIGHEWINFLLLLAAFAAIVRQSLQNQRPGLVARIGIGATAPPLRLQALFLCPQSCVMAAVCRTPSGVPDTYTSGRPTCAQLPPIRLVANVAAPTSV